VLSRALRAAGDAALGGEVDTRVLRTLVRDTVASEPSIRLDYVEVVDAGTLEPVDTVAAATLVAVAAFAGRTRLIDNVTIDPDSSSVDFGVTVSTVDQETP